MDIMLLGAIGELVGGVAMLATLVYLASPSQLPDQRASRHMAAARTSGFTYPLDSLSNR